MATGPYVNMDGEPTYQMKTSCAAAVEGGPQAQAGGRARGRVPRCRRGNAELHFARPRKGQVASMVVGMGRHRGRYVKLVQ